MLKCISCTINITVAIVGSDGNNTFAAHTPNPEYYMFPNRYAQNICSRITRTNILYIKVLVNVLSWAPVHWVAIRVRVGAAEVREFIIRGILEGSTGILNPKP